MFEFNGWATIRASYEYGNETREKELTEETALKLAADQIELFLAEALWFSSKAFRSLLFWSNGELMVLVGGRSNHLRQDPFELFKFIGEVAPGSYGLLYIQDDENSDGMEDEFQAWILKKGDFTQGKDTFLSPVNSEIEIDVSRFDA